MRPKANSPHAEFAVQALDGILQLRALDFELQVAKAKTEQLLVRERFPCIPRLAGARSLFSGLQHMMRNYTLAPSIIPRNQPPALTIRRRAVPVRRPFRLRR